MRRSLALGLAVLSVAAIALWVGVAALRVGHPFVLEWQEGGMLAHVQRVRAGLPLYVEPGLEHAPFPYPPLYFWAVALVGDGLVALRAVSIAATVALLALAFLHVRRASGQALAGLVAAGVFAASHRWAGAWFDVGRVDLLALALALASLHVARFREGWRWAALAGALAGLAFLTKQTAILVAGPMVVHLVLADRRAAASFAAAALLAGGGGVLALHVASDGWSTWTLFELLAGHPLHEPWSIWSRDLPWLLPAFALFGVTRFPVAPALGMLAAAWLGRAHQGGAANTLLPAALLAALVVGEAVGRWRTLVPVLALAAVQLLLLAHDPRPLVPTDADVAAGRRIRERLAEVAGPVFAPHQPELAGAPCAHGQAILDLLSSTAAREEAQAFVDVLERALAERRYGAVLLAQPWPDLRALSRHYPRRVDLLEGEPEDLLRPVTGHPHRPRWLYLPAER